MVFLTSLDILDTGFLAVDRDANGDRSNQVTSANRVNLGVALRLKGVNFDITSSSNVDKTATPGKLTTNRNGLVSVNPDQITISIMLNQRHTDTNNPYGTNDMSYVAALNKLPKTLGFKAVYYPVDDTATGDDRKKDVQLPTLLGEKDTTQDQGDIDISLWNGSTNVSGKDLTDVKYIGVRFESCQITQTPSNSIRVALSGVITD
jgi:hypothetical protein